METEGPASRSRRKHSSEFKAEVIKACQQPGASVRSVALAWGLNPSLVRHWLASRGTGAGPNVARPALQPLTQATSGFVALGIENQQTAAPASIRLEMRRGACAVFVDWPVQEALACGAWLREWLR